MILAILKNQQQHDLFNKQGFLVIDLLENRVLENLLMLYQQQNIKSTSNQGMLLGGLIDDIIYKVEISNKINSIIQHSIENLFVNYQIQSSSFITKKATKKSEFLPHQDWTMVDEDQFVSCNIWIPLQDITMENGPIFVLPGSHYANYPIKRSHSFGYYFDAYRDVVYNYLTPILIKKGQAILLNHSLIHYSSPNFSKQERLVTICAIKSKDAPNIMYFKPDEKDKLETYKMPEEIAFRYSEFALQPQRLPYGDLIKSELFTGYAFSKPTVRSMFKEMVLKSSIAKNKLDIFKLNVANFIRKLKGFYPNKN